jgi:sRNA-binding carbon storage regulator CsrA
MLVLSRRPDSSILVGHDVSVRVELVAGDVVCLTLKAAGLVHRRPATALVA